MKNPIQEEKPTKGSVRVARGGSWNDAPLFVRASLRNGFDPAYELNDLGFRIVRNKDQM